jgi:hypothetical protein
MNISPQYAERVEALRARKRREKQSLAEEGSSPSISSEVESASSTRDPPRASSAGSKFSQCVDEQYDVHYQVENVPDHAGAMESMRPLTGSWTCEEFEGA